MTGPKMRISSRFVFLPLLACVCLLAVPLHAQSLVTADKRADITVFGAYTYNKPDYGEFHNNGMTFGADYTRYYHWFVQPSLEIRGGFDSGTVIRQKTALAGFRLKADLRRYHPYADFLVGGTWINFVTPPYPSYTHDQGFTTSFGGGIDIDVYRNWAAKIDFQKESTTYSDQFNPIHLNPTKLSGGVVYRIPFKKHISHGYER